MWDGRQMGKKKEVWLHILSGEKYYFSVQAVDLTVCTYTDWCTGLPTKPLCVFYFVHSITGTSSSTGKTFSRSLVKLSCDSCTIECFNIWSNHHHKVAHHIRQECQWLCNSTIYPVALWVMVGSLNVQIAYFRFGTKFEQHVVDVIYFSKMDT